MPTVLITGGNRGIGLGLVKAYAERGWRTIAAVRDPSKMEGVNGVLVVKLDQSSLTGSAEAVEELKRHGIEAIDVVIVNAAIHISQADFLNLDMNDYEQVWQTNVRGPIVVFQAFFPLLSSEAKFSVISSGRGTIGQEHNKAEAAYGQSKAAVNFFVSKLSYEQPNLIVLAIDPGWIKTDMGNQGAKWNGMTEAKCELDDNLPGIIKVIDTATKETSGKFLSWEGEEKPW